MTSHLVILLGFSILVGTFFGALSREQARDAFKVGLVLTLSMVLLSLLVAYLMYPFPG